MEVNGNGWMRMDVSGCVRMCPDVGGCGCNVDGWRLRERYGH
jgi:hypothetical protein